MPHTIAVAGKGGVGKTTTCGMLIDYLCKKKNGPVLVVDADANSNLNEVLGVEVETSLGQIREEMAQAELKGTIPAGMTKADYAEMKFSQALIEDDDFDMLVMGRTQGKGCYCYVNGRNSITSLHRPHAVDDAELRSQCRMDRCGYHHR